ncbi:hypothetical protein [Hymenobacter metallicola]|uniref:Uncharacterized protein n=1 Tax=Hymenobacter metallicola TaxID=2563114 RepID=A0A4Z0QM58_9BACT|nr:hypothetical protein [Hymenobacter metallicola]TGE29832.1 hypothetical protein E5K02_10335 [Hymenobacter metallicola]
MKIETKFVFLYRKSRQNSYLSSQPQPRYMTKGILICFGGAFLSVLLLLTAYPWLLPAPTNPVVYAVWQMGFGVLLLLADCFWVLIYHLRYAERLEE